MKSCGSSYMAMAAHGFMHVDAVQSQHDQAIGNMIRPPVALYRYNVLTFLYVNTPSS